MPDQRRTSHSLSTSIVLGALFCALQTTVAAEVLQLDVTTPRAFGYVIGDTITHEIHLELAQPFRLDTTSLPQPGQLELLLELHEPVVQQRGQRYAIELVYQLTGIATDSRMQVIPGYELKVTDGEQARPVIIPAWRFQMSDLVTVADAAAISASSLRSNRAPPPMPLTAHTTRLVLLGLGVMTALGFLFYLHVGLPWIARRNRPFRLALRRLKRLRNESWTADRQRRALRLMHVAFNATAGRVIFASGLNDLFREHPQFVPLRTRIAALYRQSQQIFFETDSGTTPHSDEPRLTSLIALCRQCSNVERNTA